MEEDRRDSGPPIPPGPGGIGPLVLSISLAGFVVAGMITLGALAESLRPGGMSDPANLLLVCLVVFPLAVFLGLAVDRDGAPTAADALALRPAPRSTVPLSILFGIAAVLPLAEADNVMQAFFPASDLEKRIMLDLLSFDGWASHLLKALAIVAVTPIGEELLFRGLVLRWLRRSYGRFAGIAVSSVLFAAAHLSFRAFVPILLLGIFLAWVVDRSRSVLPAIGAHAIYNAAPFLVPPSAVDLPGWTPSMHAQVQHLPALPVVVSSAACIVLVYAIWWSTLRRN